MFFLVSATLENCVFQCLAFFDVSEPSFFVFFSVLHFFDVSEPSFFVFFEVLLFFWLYGNGRKLLFLRVYRKRLHRPTTANLKQNQVFDEAASPQPVENTPKPVKTHQKP